MSDNSARLALPYIQPSQAQKHVTHNEALARLDVLVQLVLEETDASTPPALPEPGQIWALRTAPQTAWAGQPGMLAQWDGSGWLFVAPQTGWRAWLRSSGSLGVFDGTGWIQTEASQTVDGLGIQASWDATNRLAVSAQASLFSHAGQGHQVKVNKAGASDTASLLYQSDWTGHAEMGLAGNNDFAIKVSPDGANWTDAMVVDAATGTVRGAAVQSSATDLAAGKLAQAALTYGPGNVVGTVAQSGGVPTGAVIESGTNADGAFVRFTDGTQICTRIVDIAGLDITTDLGGVFVCDPVSYDFPASFTEVHHVSGTLGASENTDIDDRAWFGKFRAGGQGLDAAWRNIAIYSPSAVSATPTEATRLSLFASGRWV